VFFHLEQWFVQAFVRQAVAFELFAIFCNRGVFGLGAWLPFGQLPGEFLFFTPLEVYLERSVFFSLEPLPLVSCTLGLNSLSRRNCPLQLLYFFFRDFKSFLVNLLLPWGLLQTSSRSSPFLFGRVYVLPFSYSQTTSFFAWGVLS